MIDLGLTGSRAMVVGAGYLPDRAGLGSTTASRLAAAGAQIACLDLSGDRAAETAAHITADGGRAFPIVLDVTDPSAVDAAVGEAVERMGGIDVCVDIVGHTNWSRVVDTTPGEWDRTLLENLTQVFYVFKAVAPQMIRQGTGGSLIALSSIDGMQSARFHGAYGAAKAGLIALIQTMSDELGRNGIRVNAVAPGNVGGGNLHAPEVGWGEDPLNPLAPPRAKDVADAVLFLASSLAERVTGQNILVDGGALCQSRWSSPEDETTDDNLRRLVAGRD